MDAPDLARLCKATARQLDRDGEALAAEILRLSAMVLNEIADEQWTQAHAFIPIPLWDDGGRRPV